MTDVKQDVTFGFIEDGTASRYWLRIGKDKVLPTEFSDVIVPYIETMLANHDVQKEREMLEAIDDGKRYHSMAVIRQAIRKVYGHDS